MCASFDLTGNGLLYSHEETLSVWWLICLLWQHTPSGHTCKFICYHNLSIRGYSEWGCFLVPNRQPFLSLQSPWKSLIDSAFESLFFHVPLGPQYHFFSVGVHSSMITTISSIFFIFLCNRGTDKLSYQILSHFKKLGVVGEKSLCGVISFYNILHIFQYILESS